MDYQNPAESVVVVLPEEIDVANSESMREQLLSAFKPGVKVVIADMTGTAFCDSAGFRSLLITHNDASASGVMLRLVIQPGSVQRVLMILGLDRVLFVYPSLDEAQCDQLVRVVV